MEPLQPAFQGAWRRPGMIEAAVVSTANDILYTDLRLTPDEVRAQSLDASGALIIAVHHSAVAAQLLHQQDGLLKKINQQVQRRFGPNTPVVKRLVSRVSL